MDNYIADMAKYANNTDSVKIRACCNSIPAQLAKKNKKIQYKVVQKNRCCSMRCSAFEGFLAHDIGAETLAKFWPKFCGADQFQQEAIK